MLKRLTVVIASLVSAVAVATTAHAIPQTITYRTLVVPRNGWALTVQGNNRNYVIGTFNLMIGNFGQAFGIDDPWYHEQRIALAILRLRGLQARLGLLGVYSRSSLGAPLEAELTEHRCVPRQTEPRSECRALTFDREQLASRTSVLTVFGAVTD